MKMIVDLVVKQLCYNCLNAWATNCATFRNQKSYVVVLFFYIKL